MHYCTQFWKPKYTGVFKNYANYYQNTCICNLYTQRNVYVKNLMHKCPYPLFETTEPMNCSIFQKYTDTPRSNQSLPVHNI
jgi:ferredoxin-thioredoxin reductase catalytic subunit